MVATLIAHCWRPHQLHKNNGSSAFLRHWIPWAAPKLKFFWSSAICSNCPERGGFRTGALGFTSCWSMQMHLVPTGHWKKKACDLCVWWLLIDFSWRGTMALNFHCWGRCPYHCVARGDATYYSLFFPHHFICRWI